MPVLVLSGVMVFVVFGGFVIVAVIGVPNAMAGASETVDGLRFTPLSGWEVARRVSGRTPAIQLSKGPGNLLVVVFPGEADPATVLDRYIAKVLQPEALRLQLSPDVERVPLGSGIAAVRRFYAGTFQGTRRPSRGTSPHSPFPPVEEWSSMDGPRRAPTSRFTEEVSGWPPRPRSHQAAPPAPEAPAPVGPSGSHCSSCGSRRGSTWASCRWRACSPCSSRRPSWPWPQWGGSSPGSCWPSTRCRCSCYFLDLYEKQPLSLVFGALLWGAVVATALAGIANFGWGLVVQDAGGPGFAARWAPALTAPLVEETLKGAGVVMIYLIARREVDDMMDGFVYGAMVGLGFTVVEDVFYFVARFGGQPVAVLIGFFIRVIASGLYSHILWTGLTGMGVGYFVSRVGEASRVKRVAVAGALFLTAVAGHVLWDSPVLDLFPRSVTTATDLLQGVWAAAVKGLPLLGVVAGMVILARRRAASLAADRADHRAGPRGDPRGGDGGPGHAASRKEQINLAMVATRVDEDHPDLLNQRRYSRALREAVALSLAPPPPA